MQITQTGYTVRNASIQDWNVILDGISEMNLDNRALSIDQFVVCDVGNELAGFGRIKKHHGADEFCSLGVFERFRNNGVGKELIRARILKSTQQIFMVTIIPEYFETLGFQITPEYPEALQLKMIHCKLYFDCEDPVVMTYPFKN